MITYSVQESAKILGIRKQRMYDLIADGSVRSFKLGKGIKIPDYELRRYIDGLLESK